MGPWSGYNPFLMPFIRVITLLTLFITSKGPTLQFNQCFCLMVILLGPAFQAPRDPVISPEFDRYGFGVQINSKPQPQFRCGWMSRMKGILQNFKTVALMDPIEN